MQNRKIWLYKGIQCRNNKWKIFELNKTESWQYCKSLLSKVTFFKILDPFVFSYSANQAIPYINVLLKTIRFLIIRTSKVFVLFVQ